MPHFLATYPDFFALSLVLLLMGETGGQSDIGWEELGGWGCRGGRAWGWKEWVGVRTGTKGLWTERQEGET